jgi:hypothetical protein
MTITNISKKICFVLTILSLSGFDVYAKPLSGTVRDSSGISVIGAKVTLAGKGATTFTDSSITDSSGTYSFPNFPLGIYSFSVTKPAYFQYQEDILLGDAALIKNVVLFKAPRGTMHQGNASGIWSPAGNPHMLTADIHVRDSLYIMPGCTLTCPNNAFYRVVLDSGYVLRIGSQTGGRTVFIRTGFASYGDSGRVYLENTSIDNAYVTFYSGKTLKINSSAFSSCDYWDNVKPHDSLIILHSTFTGKTPRCYTDHGSGAAIDPTTVTNLTFGGGFLKIAESQFYAINLYFSDCISLSFAHNIFRQFTYSNTISTAYAGGCYLQSNSHSVVLSHNNIDYLNCYALYDSSSVVNNIIGRLAFTNTSTSYVSPFSYNIISSLENNPIFGLDQNIRTNKNNDSCDLWYNLKVNPLFSDTNHNALLQNSPAIGAANDGTNIGYYQGTNAILKNTSDAAQNLRNGLSISYFHNTIRFDLYAIKKELNSSFLIFRPDGKKVLEQSIVEGQSVVSVNAAKLSNGFYLAALKFNKTIYAQRAFTKR